MTTHVRSYKCGAMFCSRFILQKRTSYLGDQWRCGIETVSTRSDSIFVQVWDQHLPLSPNKMFSPPKKL